MEHGHRVIVGTLEHYVRVIITLVNSLLCLVVHEMERVVRLLHLGHYTFSARVNVLREKEADELPF